MTTQSERGLALEAARRAALLTLAVQSEMPDRMDKTGKEPVTIADFGAQAVIGALLQAEFPGDRVVAEESAADFEKLADHDQQAAVIRHVGQALDADVSSSQVAKWLDFGRDATSSRMWMIDPIDGTKGFLRKEQFAIAIGFAIGGQLVAGALACPRLPVDPHQPDGEYGLILTAARGAGTTAEKLSGGAAWGVSASPASTPDDARAVESVESAHGDHTASAKTLAVLGVTRPPLRLDSQAKYAAVALGRAELYLRMQSRPDYRERVWDHAAGALVVMEAGGNVTDLYGQALDFTRGERLQANRGVLASNGLLHQATLDALREAGI